MNNQADNRLTHSPEAISVNHRFYDAKFMVYVEGDDDITFWDEMFRKSIPSEYPLRQPHLLS